MNRALCAAVLFSSLLAEPPSAAGAAGKTVRFKTADGWAIAARYRSPRPGRPVAILVHGVAAGKGEWETLQSELARRGIGSLALDMRGHGDSTAGPSGPRDFRDFDRTEEWPKATRDLAAAVSFVERQGIPRSRVGFIGGSVGANLAAQAVGSPKGRGRWLIIFSPGVDYRGVRLPPPPQDIPALVAASREDAYAYRTAQAYAAARPGVTMLRASQGHGAQMLSDPEFLKKLLDWIERNSR